MGLQGKSLDVTAEAPGKGGLAVAGQSCENDGHDSNPSMMAGEIPEIAPMDATGRRAPQLSPDFVIIRFSLVSTLYHRGRIRP
jgi:hypothetical protein